MARALASVEASDKQSYWQQQFFDAMQRFRLLPGGRILAGSGTGHEVTLCNCFVTGRIDDDMEAIFEALKEGAITMQQGDGVGAVGYDFSTLRQAGELRNFNLSVLVSDAFMRVMEADVAWPMP